MQDDEPAQSMRYLLLAEIALVAFAGLALLQGAATRLRQELGTALNPDIAEFIAGARNSSWFFDSLSREPLHCFVIKIFLLLPLDDERCVRLASLAETVVAAACVYWVGRQVIGRGPALLVLWLFCTNSAVQHYSVSGMRAPLYVAVVVAFVGAVWRARLERPVVSGLVMGVAGALLGLTRIYGLGLFGLGLIALALELRGWRPDRRRGVLMLLGTAALCCSVFMAPAQILRESGHVSLDMTRMRAFEVRGSIELLPGDEAITFLQYLFEGRTAGEIVGRTSGNYLLYVSKYLSYSLKPLGPLAYLLPIGLLVACFSRRRLLTALWVASLVPIVFMLSLDLHAPGSGIENRLVLHVWPLSILLMVHAVCFALVRGIEAGCSRVDYVLPPSWPGIVSAMLPEERTLDASSSASLPSARNLP